MSIAEWVDAWPGDERTAFVFEGTTLTYADFAIHIEAMERALRLASVSAGDRVGWCGLNRIELFEALFACARIGAVLVPYNNRLTAPEIATLIDDSDPSLLLATDGYAEVLRSAADGRAVRDLDQKPIDHADERSRSSNVGSVAASPTPVAASPTPGEQAPLLMVYTSGTTGESKGAVLTHRSVDYTVRNGIAHQQMTATDVVLAPLPTFHVGGLNIQTLPALRVGATVVLQRRFDPADALRLIERERVTQTLLVPAMLNAVAAEPGFATADLSSLTGINSGSSVVPLAAMQPFFDRGIPVGQVYGTTETGPTAVVLDYADGLAHVGTCGRPAAHTAMRVVNAAGDVVPDGEAGEVHVCGPHLFSGYWGRPEATAAVFDGEWFRTGDVGYVDEAGYLVISDRMTDVIISGGENIYPAEIEPVLSHHPSIREVAVVAQPDDRWGEAPTAVVVLHDGAELTLDQLQEWCRERLARFKQPQHLHCVDALPRTALGKVKKHELRAGLATS